MEKKTKENVELADAFCCIKNKQRIQIFIWYIRCGNFCAVLSVLDKRLFVKAWTDQ